MGVKTALLRSNPSAVPWVSYFYVCTRGVMSKNITSLMGIMHCTRPIGTSSIKVSVGGVCLAIVMCLSGHTAGTRMGWKWPKAQKIEA